MFSAQGTGREFHSAMALQDDRITLHGKLLQPKTLITIATPIRAQRDILALGRRLHKGVCVPRHSQIRIRNESPPWMPQAPPRHPPVGRRHSMKPPQAPSPRRHQHPPHHRQPPPRRRACSGCARCARSNKLLCRPPKALCTMRLSRKSQRHFPVVREAGLPAEVGHDRPARSCYGVMFARSVGLFL